MLFSVVWLELAYYQGGNQPRVVFWWLAGYSGLALVGARLWGDGGCTMAKASPPSSR